MKIIEKVDNYLNENKDVNLREIKKLLNGWNKRFKGNQKKIRQTILSNIVNSRWKSNAYVEAMWQEFNKMFPS